MTPEIERRIQEFKIRMETELDFCEELFQHATVRLMAGKYAYYIMNKIFMKDVAYDILEKSWYVMGLALGHLSEDMHSPCIDWDETHPQAEAGKKLAKRLSRDREEE